MSERGVIGWIALVIVIAFALLLIGLVQLIIPGDHDDKNGYARVELASRGNDDDDEGDGQRCFMLCDVRGPFFPMPKA